MEEKFESVVEEDKLEKIGREEEEELLTQITENVLGKEKVKDELLADIEKSNLRPEETDMLELIFKNFKNMKIFKEDSNGKESNEDEEESKKENEVELNICEMEGDTNFAKLIEIKDVISETVEAKDDAEDLNSFDLPNRILRVMVEKCDFAKMLTKDKKLLLPVVEKEKNVEEFKVRDYVEHDKKYFFVHSARIRCKLCSFKGKHIVLHYRKSHPESEMLISRIRPDIAEVLIEDAIRNREEYDKDHSKLKRRCNFKCPFCLMIIKNYPNAYYNHISTHTGEYRFCCDYCSFATYNSSKIRNHLNQIHYKIRENRYKMAYPNLKISKYIFGYICSECNFIQLIRATVEKHSIAYHSVMPEIHKVNLGVLLHEDVVDKNHTNVIHSNENHSNPNSNLKMSIETKNLKVFNISSQFEELEEVKVKIESEILDDNPCPIEVSTFIHQPDLDIKQDSESNRVDTLQWTDENTRKVSKLVTEPLKEVKEEVLSPEVKYPEITSDQLLGLKPKHLVLTSGDYPKGTSVLRNILTTGIEKQNRKCSNVMKPSLLNRNLNELVPPYNCKDDGFPSCPFKSLYFSEYLKHVEATHQIDGLCSFSSEDEMLNKTVMEGWLMKEVGPFQCRYCKKATVTHQEMRRHQTLFHAQEQSFFYYRKFVPNDTVTVPEQVNLEDPSFINHVIHLPDQVHLCDFKLTDNLLSSSSAELIDGASEIDSNQTKVLLDEAGLLSKPDPQCVTEESSEVELTNEVIKCKWVGCYQTFDSQAAMVNHIKKNHFKIQKGEEFTCCWSNCPRESKPFNEKSMLKRHIKIHSGEKPHKCPFPGCNKAFLERPYLKIHQRSHTGERPYLCQFPNCFKSFAKSTCRNVHQRTHYDPKPFACLVNGCSKKYSASSTLCVHMKTHTIDERLEAKQKSIENKQKKSHFVRKKPFNSSDMVKYQRAHHNTCEWEGCHQTLDSQVALIDHIKKNHLMIQKGKQFTCCWNNCPRKSKPFSRRFTLWTHIKIHSGEKPNKCHFPGCNKTFIQLGNLKIHESRHTRERTHYDPKPFVCQVTGCLKRYSVPSTLSIHMKTHTIDERLEAKQKSIENKQKKSQRTHHNTCKWENCYQINHSQTALIKHIEENHVELQKGEEFTCSWINCSRKLEPYTKKQHLLLHIRAHSEEKPHKCPFQGCNRSFLKSEYLKIHQRTHTGERPYLCEFPNCFQSFICASHRYHHQKTHYETNLYVCQVPNCSKIYRYSTLLRRHLKKHTVGEQLEAKQKSLENKQKSDDFVVKKFFNSVDEAKQQRTHYDILQCKWKDCYQTTHYSHPALVKHIKEDHVMLQKAEKFICYWINCPRKSKPFFLRNGLLKHVTRHGRVHSEEKPHKCPIQGCNRAFPRLESLRVHQRSHTGEKPYVCQFPNCFKSFTTSYQRNKHQKGHDDISSKKKQKKDEAKRQRMHHNTCEWEGCYQTHDSQVALIRHIENDHVKVQKVQEFTCCWTNCLRKSKPFKTKSMLLKHMRIHSGQKPHKCPFPDCNKEFLQRAYLKIHERSHTGERPYLCQFPNCLKSFANSICRDVHQKIHYDPKPCACQVIGCSKRFSSPGYLWKHMRTHTVDERLEARKKLIENIRNKRQFVPKKPCNNSNRTKDNTCKWEGCYETNYSPSALGKHIEEEHIKLHTSKEFTCFWLNCPRKSKPFYKRSCLLTHVRIHSGDKPHKCAFQGCNKAFIRPGLLKIHQMTHTEERPYLCQFPNCFASFCNSSDRDGHQSTHYNMSHSENHMVDEQPEQKQSKLRQLLESGKNNQKEDDFIVYTI